MAIAFFIMLCRQIHCSYLIGLSIQHTKYHMITNAQSFIVCLCTDSVSATSLVKLSWKKSPLRRNSSVNCLRYGSRHFCSFNGVSSSGSYSVFQSSGFQHWFKNWQDLRRNKLTASTFGGAVGFWPHRRVQLWQEKVGLIAPFSSNFAVCWNNIKEEEALARYKLITGATISFTELQPYNKTSPEDDWLAASPDGLLEHMVHGVPFGGIVEIKCPFFRGEVGRGRPWSRIPLHCMPQAQGLMEIMNRDWMDLYCWTLNGSSLFRIYRDKQYWALVKSALSDLWWKHVQPAKRLLHDDPSIHIKKVVELFEPKSRHELCPDIVRVSKQLVDNSELKVFEIHGKPLVFVL